jgi:hypothetical protein
VEGNRLPQGVPKRAFVRLPLELVACTAHQCDAHRIRHGASRRPPFPTYGYQLLGVDYLVDRQLRPWLLEFNSAPSIMALVRWEVLF